MRGETWKKLLGVDKVANKSTVYEVIIYFILVLQSTALY